MVYLFLLELLIHRLGDPKCVVSEISGCSDMYVVIRYVTVSVRRTGTFLVVNKEYILNPSLSCHVGLHEYLFVQQGLPSNKKCQLWAKTQDFDIKVKKSNSCT